MFWKKKKKFDKNPLTKTQKVKDVFSRYFFITLGAIIAGFSLEAFLIPRNIIDGGIVGISMMVSYVTKWHLGVLLILLNIPFILLSLQKIGKQFVINVLYAVTILAISVHFFESLQPATDKDLLATVFGGMILGTGVGLILRNNGALDGTEILAIRLAKKFGFSIGEIIMFFNFFIYTAAGFLYGWDSAMYSILTYFIAYRVIDIVLEGFNSSKSALIISNSYQEIGDAIIKEFDISVTYQKGRGGYSGQEQHMVYCVISRLEIAKMKKLIRDIDPTAFFVIQEVHEVDGVRINKK